MCTKIHVQGGSQKASHIKQKTETNQILVKRRTNKENVHEACSRILHNRKTNTNELHLHRWTLGTEREGTIHVAVKSDFIYPMFKTSKLNNTFLEINTYMVRLLRWTLPL